VDHPILGTQDKATVVEIVVDGTLVRAREGEMLAATLIAEGIRVFHYSTKRKEPRGVFCAIGRCTDCVMIVDGVPNVRTCVTPVRAGMVVQTQHGLGDWGDQNESR
jgi:predicted molibdopterin-dependent oxidoreductase YjgC